MQPPAGTRLRRHAPLLLLRWRQLCLQASSRRLPCAYRLTSPGRRRSNALRVWRAAGVGVLLCCWVCSSSSKRPAWIEMHACPSPADECEPGRAARVGDALLCSRCEAVNCHNRRRYARYLTPRGLFVTPIVCNRRLYRTFEDSRRCHGPPAAHPKHSMPGTAARYFSRRPCTETPRPCAP